MSIGEVISAFALCASSFDDDKDRLLMLRDVYEIEVHYKYIIIYFVDRNTPSIKVYKDGTCSTLTERNLKENGR